MKLCLSAGFLVAALAAGESERQPAFTVLFTGETHGALLPCDCPIQLLGGVARRATLIRRYRARGPVLLADAGNWAAGGFYDEDSDGEPEHERLRSELMAQALAAMGYQVVGVGEAERAQAEAARQALPPGQDSLWWQPLARALPGQWTDGAGSLPATSRLTLAGHTIGVGSFEKPAQAAALEAALRAGTWTAAGQGDFLLGLSQLGEEQTGSWAARLPFDLVLNAGRKSSTRTAWTAGNAVVANFDFQGQRLGVAEVYPRRGWSPGQSGPRWEIRVRQEPVTAETPEDPEIAALLRPHTALLNRKGVRRLTAEFWLMAHCPHCAPLTPLLEQLAAALAGRVVIAPRFLVGKDGAGRLRALHGEGEMEENRIQVLIARYYPEKFWAWRRWRAEEGNGAKRWEEGCRALGLLQARLAGALRAGEAEELLERDFQLSLRRRIRGTPTLLLGSRVYEGEWERDRLLRVFCGLLQEPRPEVCRSVPACFLDAECRKRGFIGRCLEAGTPRARCDFSQPAVRVQARVILDKEALWSNHEKILEVLLNYLPGLEWRLVEAGSAEGLALLERLKVERLPAYLLGAEAKREVDFAGNLGDAVEEHPEGLVLKSALTGARRFWPARRARGRADLYLSRFGQAGQEAAETALEARRWADNRPEVEVYDQVFWLETAGPEGRTERVLTARGGRAELDEAALALAVRLTAPERLPAYLLARGRARGTLFWDQAVRESGADEARVRALAEGPAPEVRAALEATADRLKELRAEGEVVLWAEECELIPVSSREELRYYLEEIGKRLNRSGALPPGLTEPRGGK